MFGQLESWNFGYIFPLHFVSTAPKVLCVLRMQSLLPQCTEQWYAWVFLWGRFRKPSLETGCSLTISLMPAYNERPCAPQFGRLSACVHLCLYKFDSVPVTLIGLSGPCVWVHVGSWARLASVGWRLSVHTVQQPVTPSPLFLSLALSGLFCCQCKLVPVMDYSRTGTNLSWHSQNSLPPYWDQLHRMLSPIVPYSEYTIPFSLSALHTKRPHSLTWTLP